MSFVAQAVEHIEKAKRANPTSKSASALAELKKENERLNSELAAKIDELRKLQTQLDEQVSAPVAAPAKESVHCDVCSTTILKSSLANHLKSKMHTRLASPPENP
jgi:predicted nuclease with TOPRIM domain